MVPQVLLGATGVLTRALKWTLPMFAPLVKCKGFPSPTASVLWTAKDIVIGSCKKSPPAVGVTATAPGCTHRLG